MKVALGSVDVPDILRRAIRHHTGEKGLATRTEVRDHCLENGVSCDPDFIEELLAAEPRWAEDQENVSK